MLALVLEFRSKVGRFGVDTLRSCVWRVVVLGVLVCKQAHAAVVASALCVFVLIESTRRREQPKTTAGDSCV